MRTQTYVAIVVLALLGLGVSLTAHPTAAQQLASGTPKNAEAPKLPTADLLPTLDSSGSWLFRKQVNEVTVMFTALHKGKFVTDLDRNDVQVRDDKRPPEQILDFRNEEDLPLRMALLVDTSGSVTDRFHFEQRAAGQFLDQVLDRQHDSAFVVGFSHRARLISDFTNNSERLTSATTTMHDDNGDTAVFDAVAAACKKLAEHPERQPVARVLVLVSDGDDNASRLSLEQVLQIAQADEVTVYTISSNPRGVNLIGDQALDKIAEGTGGKSLFPGSSKQVAKAFGNIRDELRSRYAVSYRPAAFAPDGHFRKIRIVARKFGKKLRVHARKGYYARAIAPPPVPLELAGSE